jgi:general secretion pathway protein H
MRKVVKGKTRISGSDPETVNPGLVTSSAGLPTGFSLFELLIALALVTAVLALAPAYLSRGISSAELKSSARQIGSGLQAARAEAISGNRERVFVLDVEQRRFFIGENGAVNELPGDLQLTIKTAESERISEAQGGIRFFPDGSSTGGEVTLSSTNGSLKVAVNWVTGKTNIVPVE